MSALGSGRDALKFRCPLYPRKQTSLSAITMSANSERSSRSANCFLLSFQLVEPPLQFRVVDLAIILYLFQHEI